MCLDLEYCCVWEGVLLFKVILSFTLGDGIGGFLMVAVSTLGSPAVMGCIVARLSACASCTYAFVILDPYCSDGMRFFGSCGIASISVAAWRR